ncbi:MAG: carboxypeptidase-like regulatory domain-containing protein [Saprospiraceae bacterium]|nr:carboxypeptidase-like regulatory domain-containing protein [Saprospiraceae bacterium]
MKRFSLLLTMFLLSITFMMAQKNISGKIVDEKGSPVIGANILIKGTSTGTISDFDGNYTINAPAGAALVVSYTGYSSKEVIVGNSNLLNVTLAEDAALLNEVVVTAFGISRAQKALGYSTEKVDASKLQQKSEPDVLRALQKSS